MYLIQQEINKLQSSYQQIIEQIDYLEDGYIALNTNTYEVLQDSMQSASTVTEYINNYINEDNRAIANNLHVLNKYYKYLLREALENNSREKLFELKYHLLELCDRF